MNDNIQLLHNYCQFEQGWVWIMTGLSRNKDNPNPTHDFLRRLVIAKPEEIEPCYQELQTLGNRKGTTYRIYISLNARDANKAFFNFQQKLLEINLGLYRGLQDAQHLVTKVGSLWKTELAQTHNRATKYFLLDVDEDANGEVATRIVSFINDPDRKMKTKIVAIRKTVSGSHIVIEACDTRELMNWCELNEFKVDVQKDSMLFVEQYEGKA
jgi:hypothetical protein